MDSRTGVFPAGFHLPPLILHPFTDSSGPSKLLKSSRATLALQGLVPDEGESESELERALLDGRYCEVRMLCYVGKDLNRWVEQCMEVISRHEEWSKLDLRYASFVNLLIMQTPRNVSEKLQRWGVVDYHAIFRRGIGLSTVFTDMPNIEQMNPEFLKAYHHYADQLYAVRMDRETHAIIDPSWFEFQLYASGEYARMLERSWQE